MRLNKYIALCGIASRRGADKLIADGKVKVNGFTVDTMGPDIDPERDTVSIDGKTIEQQSGNIYIMLNKPAGYLSSCSDDRGRRTVLDLINGIDSRLFPVGRLDADTEGLLLLTNDGDFAYKCTHPKHELNKKYYAEIDGYLDDENMNVLQSGVSIDGIMTSKSEIVLKENSGIGAKLFITIHEGRNRQIKKMFEHIGRRVRYLKRVSIGNLNLGELKKGEWRYLNEEDFKLLRLK